MSIKIIIHFPSNDECWPQYNKNDTHLVWVKISKLKKKLMVWIWIKQQKPLNSEYLKATLGVSEGKLDKKKE